MDISPPPGNFRAGSFLARGTTFQFSPSLTARGGKEAPLVAALMIMIILTGCSLTPDTSRSEKDDTLDIAVDGNSDPLGLLMVGNDIIYSDIDSVGVGEVSPDMTASLLLPGHGRATILTVQVTENYTLCRLQEDVWSYHLVVAAGRFEKGSAELDTISGLSPFCAKDHTESYFASDSDLDDDQLSQLCNTDQNFTVHGFAKPEDIEETGSQIHEYAEELSRNRATAFAAALEEESLLEVNEVRWHGLAVSSYERLRSTDDESSTVIGALLIPEGEAVPMSVVGLGPALTEKERANLIALRENMERTASEVGVTERPHLSIHMDGEFADQYSDELEDEFSVAVDDEYSRAFTTWIRNFQSDRCDWFAVGSAL